MSMTMEQVVTQLQQELFTLRAQVAAESGLADAVRAIINLATGQLRNDTPSLIDVKGPGRPKEFSGKEEDFQQWSKKTEAFFAGVIKESEMMLERTAEQTTEITTELIDREFLPTATNQEREEYKTWSLCCSMHTAVMALTSNEANDIVANSRKNPLEAWRRLQKRYDPTTGGRKRNLLRTIISPGRCSLQELLAGIERWVSYVSRYEKKLKDKMDDEIKLAGLEALVPEELEKHLILNSDPLRTFGDARLEIMTYVEVEDIFNETAMQARTPASNRLAKANRASHDQRVKAKERVKRTRENPKDSPKDPKMPNKGKTSKTGISSLENLKSETSSNGTCLYH